MIEEQDSGSSSRGSAPAVSQSWIGERTPRRLKQTRRGHRIEGRVCGTVSVPLAHPQLGGGRDLGYRRPRRTSRAGLAGVPDSHQPRSTRSERKALHRRRRDPAVTLVVLEPPHRSRASHTAELRPANVKVLWHAPIVPAPLRAMALGCLATAIGLSQHGGTGRRQGSPRIGQRTFRRRPIGLIPFSRGVAVAEGPPNACYHAIGDRGRKSSSLAARAQRRLPGRR